MLAPDYTPVLSRESVRDLDSLTIESGTASLELMETAGAAIAGRMIELSDGSEPSALVIAGPGNNGGDGFVIARYLANNGWRVDAAVFPSTPSLTGSDCGINLERWKASGGSVVGPDSCLELVGDAAAAGYDFIVDALLGTGLDRNVEGQLARLIDKINASRIPVVSVDIPSGLDADSGHPLGTAVVATETVSLGAAKPGLFVGRGPDYCGHVSIADIGLNDPRGCGLDTIGQVIDTLTCRAWLPRRNPTAHKGSQGHVAIVGGSAGKSGALLLAARGALRAGAGLVTMACPAGLAARLDTGFAEAMVLELADDGAGCIAAGGWQTLKRDIDKFTCVVVGPGLGTQEGASELVAELMTEASPRLVVDADALNVLATRRDDLPKILETRRSRGKGAVVFTPHPGEMGRLTGTDSANVQSVRLQSSLAFTARHQQGTLVLKGAATIVANGNRLGFNNSGNSGMASAGMGDVLAGMIGALLAVEGDPFRAAAVAVHLHGLAADLMAARYGAPGFLASEVADSVPAALARTARQSFDDVLRS